MSSARWLITSIVLTLVGCAASQTYSTSALPYDSWSLGFVAPNHMEVWIEAAEVEDERGRVFAKLETGSASIGHRGDAAGWGGRVGFGKSRQVTGSALPRRVYVRWQSLVEPETYHVFLDIPESARQAMLTKAIHRVLSEEFYREALVVGLAPGGWVKVWVSGAAGDPIEVLCTRGEREPKGPSQGLTRGRYAYTLDKLDPATQQYLKTHAIPFESWKCDGWVSGR